MGGGGGRGSCNIGWYFYSYWNRIVKLVICPLMFIRTQSSANNLTDEVILVVMSLMYNKKICGPRAIP